MIIKKRRFEKYKMLLNEIMQEVKKEKAQESSPWPERLLNLVERGIGELLAHADKGEVYFKYYNPKRPHANRMLESCYFILIDSIPSDRFRDTILADKIQNLQDIYYKL